MYSWYTHPRVRSKCGERAIVDAQIYTSNAYDILYFIMTKQKILVVEDSDSLREVLVEKLQDENFDVISANGGESGFAVALEQKPDMIITDIVMFPVDGLDMAKRIRESGNWGANVHIITLTNQNSSEDEKRVHALHLTAYLVKADTSLDEVVKNVKTILKKKK